MKAKIVKNDKVMIITGKDKGKTGDVARVLSKEKKVMVNGVNIVKKAVKPNKKNTQGGIIEVMKPIEISNVVFVCPSCGKPTRVGISIAKNGDKSRICKKCKVAVKEQ
ncbi:MAG: 50S ribosomal protein L24 [Patescibacteria group bacterium]|jgi:large subunit ribosomal protein L24|nr:50S ribosomal protein L24 [Patescibacteria group bacterium]